MMRIRLALDEGAERALQGFSDAWGWDADANVAEAEARLVLAAWRSTREPAAIRYLDEPALGLRLLEVTGEGAEDVASWIRLLVPCRAREDLPTEIARLSDPPSFVDLMHLAAALGDPDELDPELFLVVGNGFVHFDPRVREAAILATCYLPWPQFRRALERLSESDPDLEVRAKAAERLVAS